MANVIAIAVKLKGGGNRYFLTWGHTFGSVDGSEIAGIVLRHAPGFALGGIPVKSEVCYSLLDARNSPYFYECLQYFYNTKIPMGKTRTRWANRIAKEQRKGRHLFFCGDPNHREKCRKHFWSMSKNGDFR